MAAILRTAGMRLAIDSAVPWVTDLIAEGAGGELEDGDARDASVGIRVEANRSAFATDGWEYLTRGAWRRDGEVVVENVCTAGFDLHARCTPDHAELTYRWRPPVRDRAAALVLRSRFRLLARAVLLQYPALWWAATRACAPLHATACDVGETTVLLTTAGGVGRSTLVLDEIAAGARATGDNLAVGDGTTIWGLVEPMRADRGTGRRTTHGRRESAMLGRADALEPDCLIVVRRGTSAETTFGEYGANGATRFLIANTYMAGELRRYWAFAATLAAGVRVGPAHPPVTDVAAWFAMRLPCFQLRLGTASRPPLVELLDSAKAAAWA